MAKTPESIQAQLEELRLSYVSSLPGKLESIRSLWMRFGEEHQSAAVINELHRHVHSLVGSGATFGLDGITHAARNMDNELKKLLGDPASATPETMELVSQLFHQLELSINAASGNQDEAEITTDDAAGDAERPASAVYIACADRAYADELAGELAPFGYEVRIFDGASDLEQALCDARPIALITEHNFIKVNFDEAFSPDGRDQLRKTPTIFISDTDSFDIRLEAVRMGGEAFFVRPIKIELITDMLDKLVQAEHLEPYRVLIVDDTESTARYYSLCLEQAGILTEVVTRPRDIWSKLSEFNPEIILMDMYMPDSLGTELAQLIRQHENYFSLPIVFLSAETNLNMQLNAMSIGGDDFLTKPIEASHLVSAVKIRTERFRALRALMVRDGLTGLLNHTRFKSQVDVEISRAARGHKPLLYAMIDIDRFKSVNDTYGHPVGDQVIKNLARLLTNRLRKTDVIGRYGGEEFAVLLTWTDLETGERILNDLREQFERITHHTSDGQAFTATFSGGLARFPDYTDSTALNRAADEALYAAKKGGRNRICVAGNSSSAE